MLDRDIQYFLGVAQAQSLARAAESLGISQPALTRAVQRLEKAYGLVLLERTARGVALSSAGQRLAARARQAAVIAEDAERELGDMAAGVRGALRIAAGATVAPVVTAALIPRLVIERPATSLQLDSGFNDHFLPLLAQGHYDFAVSAIPIPLPDVLQARPIVTDRMVPVVRAGHPLAVLRRVRAKQLLEYRWAMAGPLVASRRQLMESFSRAGLALPTEIIETNSYHTMLDIVSRSDCVSLAPLGQARRGTGMFAGLTYLDVGELGIVRQLGLVQRTGAYLSPLGERAAELVEIALVDAYGSPGTDHPPAGGRR